MPLKQLAGLALRDRADPAAFVEAFAGNNRFVLDYLSEEVVTRQPQAVQSFLLHTSILGRLCAPLCEAVVGHTETADGQAILESLDRANLFIVPLDDERRWYRYHHLFREVLQARLRLAESPEGIADLHRRACAWLEGEGLFSEAINHALDSQDWDTSARLVVEHGYTIGFRGQVQTVLGWIDELPPGFQQRHPDLLMMRAFMLMFGNRLAEASVQIEDAEATLQTGAPYDAPTIRGLAALARAGLAMLQGQTAQASTLGREALALLPGPEAGGSPVRPMAELLASMAYRVTGEVGAEAERAAAQALRSLRDAGDLFGVLTASTNLARLQMAQGRLRRAAATLAPVLEMARGSADLQALFSGAAYSFALADLHLERNELEQAAGYVAQGMDLVRGSMAVQAGAVFVGFLTTARLQEAHGQWQEAIASLDELTEVARERQFAPRFVRRAAAEQCAIRLRAAARMSAEETSRAVAYAERWADASGLHASDEIAYPSESEHLVLARLLLARKPQRSEDSRAGLGLLDRLLAAAEAGGRGRSSIQILVLRAMALAARSDADGSLSDLAKAIELAEPEDYIRVFLDEGPPIETLLRKAAETHVAEPYVNRLIDAFGTPPPTPHRLEPPVQPPHRAGAAGPFESLSERELEVLRLIAAGASNRDIANSLILAIGTVKKHTNNIFGKLGVSSRTQAVAKARDFSLI